MAIKLNDKQEPTENDCIWSSSKYNETKSKNKKKGHFGVRRRYDMKIV